MRRAAFMIMLVAASSLAACKKTGENTYQVETPGDVDVKTDTHTVRTPDVDIVKDTQTVVVPKVKVKKP